MIRDPRLRPAIAEELETLVSQFNRFHVALGFNRGADLPRAQIREICHAVIKRLCADADEILIYGQDETDTFRKFAANVEASRGKYRVRSGRDTVTGFEDYWGAYRSERGTVLFLVPSPDTRVGSLMSCAQDPGFLENPKAIASRSAFRYAQAAVRRSKEIVAYLLSANLGLETLFVIAHPDRILKCLALAFAHCELTPRYLRLYGVRGA